MNAKNQIFVLFVTFCIFQICQAKTVSDTAAAWNIVDITNATGIESNLPPTFLSQNNLFLIVGTNEHVYLVNYTQGKYVVSDLSQPTDASMAVPMTKLPLSFLPGSNPPYMVFSGVNSANNHVFTAVYYVSQPIWTVFDVTVNIGVPTTSLPITAVNNLEYTVISNSNNHIYSVSEDPTNANTYVYDLTSTAGIPATKVPISVLDNQYPNIQFVSAASNGTVVGSYFNQPTTSGWAIYSLSPPVPTTQYTIGVASGVQIFVVNSNNTISNCLYGSGYWSCVDQTNFPSTTQGVNVFWSNPVSLAIISTTNDVYFASYNFNLVKWEVTDMTKTYDFPQSSLPVANFGNQHFLITGTDQHVYYCYSTGLVEFLH